VVKEESSQNFKTKIHRTTCSVESAPVLAFTVFRCVKKNLQRRNFGGYTCPSPRRLRGC